MRDVIDVASIISTRLQSPETTYYQGTVLSDAYLALWQLSSAFYAAHVLDSPCGNFASNLTSGFADCKGKVVNKGLTGRDIALLQKKYFGGVQMTQGFYDWATKPGTSFASLISRAPDVTERRQTRHYLTCGHDTMFHHNKGIVGVRLEFVKNVHVTNVVVENLTNTADVGHWLCGEQFRLSTTNEFIEVQQLQVAGDLGPDVRGIAMAKIDGVVLDNVEIDNLNSLEGQVVGIALVGDANDRRDYSTRFAHQVRLGKVHVKKIVAGAGKVAKPLSSDLTSMDAGGSVVLESQTSTHNQLDAPHITMRHTVSNKTVPVSEGNYVEMSFTQAFALNHERILDVFGYTEEEMNNLAFESLAYFESEFGIPLEHWRNVDDAASLNAAHDNRSVLIPIPGKIDFTDSTAWSWRRRLVLATHHSVIFFGVGRHPGQDFHTETMCRKETCAGPLPRTPVFNYVNLVMLIDKSTAGSYLAHGLWGGPEGKLVYPNQILVQGAYLVENPPLAELGLNKHLPLDQQSAQSPDLHIKFYGTCPIDFPGTRTKLNMATKGKDTDDWRETSIINCKLDGGPLLGKGWGVGTYSLIKRNGMYTLEIVDDHIFDDRPNPYAREVGTGATNTRCGVDGSIAPTLLSVQVRADGTVPVATPFHGREIFPYTKQYHQFHEAGTKFFQAWTTLSSMSAMYAYRTKALTYFKEEMMLGTTTLNVPNPNIQRVLDDPLSEYIENNIALGGGNTIFPYATNDLINQRGYTIAGKTTPSASLLDGGIKEGGFLLSVGRVRQSHVIYQNGAACEFETCFAIESLHLS